MSRLQKKCFFGATGLHCLLLLALLVGPGFFNQKTVDDSPVIEFIPMMATDEPISGGGSPKPPAPTPAPVVEQPTPPAPAPPPRPEPEKEEKVEPVKINRPDPDALPDKPTKPQKHEVRTSSKVVKLANARPQPTKPAANPNAKANEIRRAFENAGRNISSGLSSSTKVDMPEGPGGGGVSYANYGQIVRMKYTEAWTVPDDMTDDEATIKVSVTIARDGKVLSRQIVSPSGSAAANRSIQNTLDRITTIGIPFPQGAKESQRTFIMTFNLKAKKAFG